MISHPLWIQYQPFKHSLTHLSFHLLAHSLSYSAAAMHSIGSIAAFAGLASLAIASPLDNARRASAGTFQIKQVQGGQTLKVGPVALQKAYQKFSKAVPTSVAAAAQSGAVSATPEQYDSEYLCPVTVGGSQLNLDFDTGSSDL
jgi:hypothetical protein